MSASDHLRGQQFPGTALHPQGRLFAPIGNYRGDPWKLHPQNWMKQSATPAHDDVIAWHGSEHPSLPRSDAPDERQVQEDYTSQDWNTDGDQDWEPTDYSVDHKDRPMAEYGSAVGMHFGDIKAADHRSNDKARKFLHPVRIPGDSIAHPPAGRFSTERPNEEIVAGPYRSDRVIENAATGERTPDSRWADGAANYASKATDLVEGGKTLAYRNDFEASGSTSYRALPETVRTWSEDVLGSVNPRYDMNLDAEGRRGEPGAFRGAPHPALVHLAKQGYNPVALTSANTDRFVPHDDPRSKGELDAAADNYKAGRAWGLRKPDALQDRQFGQF